MLQFQILYVSWLVLLSWESCVGLASAGPPTRFLPSQNVFLRPGGTITLRGNHPEDSDAAQQNLYTADPEDGAVLRSLKGDSTLRINMRIASPARTGAHLTIQDILHGEEGETSGESRPVSLIRIFSPAIFSRTYSDDKKEAPDTSVIENVSKTIATSPKTKQLRHLQYISLLARDNLLTKDANLTRESPGESPEIYSQGGTLYVKLRFKRDDGATDSADQGTGKDSADEGAAGSEEADADGSKVSSDDDDDEDPIEDSGKKDQRGGSASKMASDEEPSKRDKKKAAKQRKREDKKEALKAGAYGKIDMAEKNLMKIPRKLRKILASARSKGSKGKEGLSEAKDSAQEQLQKLLSRLKEVPELLSKFASSEDVEEVKERVQRIVEALGKIVQSEDFQETVKALLKMLGKVCEFVKSEEAQQVRTVVESMMKRALKHARKAAKRKLKKSAIRKLAVVG